MGHSDVGSRGRNKLWTGGGKGEGKESFVDFFAKAYASYYFTHPAEDIMRRTAIPVQGIDSKDGDVLDVGTGISGIVHIRNWESGHKLVLLDESIFITKMLMEFLKFTGKDNVEIVQADITNYNPGRKIRHIRINSALHHLFMRGNSPVEERLLAVRQLFFKKAYSILDDGGSLVIKDRTDEFEDLQEREFEGDPIAYVGANYNVNTQNFMITQAQHDLYAKHFKVVAYLCNSLKDNGFSVAIVQIGSAKDYVSRKPLISFTLEAKKNISHLQSDDLVDIAGEAGRKDL